MSIEKNFRPPLLYDKLIPLYSLNYAVFLTKEPFAKLGKWNVVFERSCDFSRQGVI